MIGRIHGTLVEKHPPQIVVDVQGVGYEIDVPMSTFYQLPATGTEVSLYTHLVVREDAHQLYGFATEPERRAFRQLLRITGIGARTAPLRQKAPREEGEHGASSWVGSVLPKKKRQRRSDAASGPSRGRTHRFPRSA